jgi:hypothetical protein
VVADRGGLARPKNQDPNTIRTCEVWLRRSKDFGELERLRALAPAFELEVGTQSVTFVDREIVLVRVTARNTSPLSG